MSNPMGLTIPTPQITTGPEYATNVSNDLTIIANHRHTGSSNSDGLQIPSAGINVNEDLSFQSNNLISLRSSRFTSQGSVLTGIGDIDCVYVVNGDLYYNNASGTPVQITSGGSVIVSSALNYITLTISSNHVIGPADPVTILECNTTSNAIIITLPSISFVPTGRFYIIKDLNGTSETFSITINPSGSNKIDQASNYVIADNHNAIYLVSDGVGNWAVLPCNRKVYFPGETIKLTGSTLSLNGSSSLNLLNSSESLVSSFLTIGNGSFLQLIAGSNFIADPTSAISISCPTTFQNGSSVEFKNGSVLLSDSGSTCTFNSGSVLNVVGASFNVTTNTVVSVLTGAKFQFGNTSELELKSGSKLTADSGSTTEFKTGSTITFDSGSTITFNSGSITTFNSGSTLFLSGVSSNTNTFINTGSMSSSGSFTLNANTKILLNLRSFAKPIFFYYGNFWSAPSGIATQDTNDPANYSVFALYLPQGANLIGWEVILKPSGHASLPATLPAAFISRLKITDLTASNIGGTVTDSSGSPGAYDTLHSISNTFSEIIDNNEFLYSLVILGEQGAGSLANPATPFSVNVSYTSAAMDDSK